MRSLIHSSGLLPSRLALAQAGRFLLAVGDVVVARGQDEIRAATGTVVQSGDTIRVGPASNAQIRLTDESIVGLRPGTLFRLDEFAYSGQGRRQRAQPLHPPQRRLPYGHGRDRAAAQSRALRGCARQPRRSASKAPLHGGPLRDNDCGTLNRVSLAALDSMRRATQRRVLANRSRTAPMAASPTDASKW